MLNTFSCQIYVVSTDYGFIWANKAFEDEIGLKLGDLKGKKCYQIFHQLDKPPEMCLLYQMMKSNEFKLMETEVERQGRRLLISGTPVLDDRGRLEKVIHIGLDVTEAQKQRGMLSEKDFQYRRIVESSQDLITQVDL